MIQETALDKPDRWNKERVLALTLNIPASAVHAGNTSLGNCSLGNAGGSLHKCYESCDIKKSPLAQWIKFCHFISLLSSTKGLFFLCNTSKYKTAKNSMFFSCHYSCFTCAYPSTTNCNCTTLWHIFTHLHHKTYEWDVCTQQWRGLRAVTSTLVKINFKQLPEVLETQRCFPTLDLPKRHWKAQLCDGKTSQLSC